MDSMTGRARPLVAVGYGPRCVPVIQLAEAAAGLCDLVWMIDTAVPGMSEMTDLLNRFGPVVDLKGMSAEQAVKMSKNQDIIDFANEMARDHKAVNDQAVALVTKLGVTPEDNPTSQALNKAAADKLAELGKLSGAAFDKAYIDNEVA